MEIYLLRHASAGESKLNLAKDDERPLDKLGIEQSHNVGQALAALEVSVDAIVSSPLPRAAQTATIVAGELGCEDKVVPDDMLRPGAGYEQFENLLRRYSRSQAIMIVGHNPSMTEFLNQFLLGEGAPNAIELKKGAIAKLEKTGGGPAVLKWCMTPKLIRSIQRASASSSRPKTVSK
jgi:phosphohistidine phosphatase